MRVGLVLASEGREPIRLRKGEPVVTIRGPIAEGVLYAYGRKDVAAVTLEGPPDAVDDGRRRPVGRLTPSHHRFGPDGGRRGDHHPDRNGVSGSSGARRPGQG